MIRIALLPGDGIGPEVLAGPIDLLAEFARAGIPVETTQPLPVGATAVRTHGEVLPAETVRECEKSDCILFGAVGDHPGITGVDRPELALITLRRKFDFGISIRHVWRPRSQPLMIVRNLLGGSYADDLLRTESDGSSPAVDPVVLDPERIRDVVTAAARIHQATPTAEIYSVDKANLLATSRLWRSVVTQMCRTAGLPVRHVLVDRFAFEIGRDLITEGLVVTEGLFGDILSDLAAARAGSIALCASASVPAHQSGRMAGLFEPVHGSAPRLFGKGRANPTGAYLALAAALAWFPETAALAEQIRDALGAVIADGLRTYDLADSPDLAVSSARFAGTVNEAVLARTEGRAA